MTKKKPQNSNRQLVPGPWTCLAPPPRHWPTWTEDWGRTSIQTVLTLDAELVRAYVTCLSTATGEEPPNRFVFLLSMLQIMPYVDVDVCIKNFLFSCVAACFEECMKVCIVKHTLSSSSSLKLYLCIEPNHVLVTTWFGAIRGACCRILFRPMLWFDEQNENIYQV